MDRKYHGVRINEKKWAIYGTLINPLTKVIFYDKVGFVFFSDKLLEWSFENTAFVTGMSAQGIEFVNDLIHDLDRLREEK